MATRCVAAIAAALVVAAPAAAADRSLVDEGRDLYGGACITCHGPDGEGITALGPKRGAGDVRGQGPSLRGVGALAADFYLRTGYMPLRSPDEQPRRRRPRFSPHQIDALVAYVASLGGGPAVPQPHPERGSLSDGLRLFTEHCAGCHQVVAEGGVVTGAVAPALENATPAQVAEAVRIGPYLMPRFSERQIGGAGLDSIVRYVQYAKHPDDRGGWAIGHLGPVTEGLVTWLIAAVALVVVALTIGKRLRA
jgi:ubiquinol-cytochrome c reductase cytochrome c subunit